jgi:hypothetical protein
MSAQSQQTNGKSPGSPVVARIIIVGLVFALLAFYLSDLFAR